MIFIVKLICRCPIIVGTRGPILLCSTRMKLALVMVCSKFVRLHWRQRSFEFHLLLCLLLIHQHLLSEPSLPSSILFSLAFLLPLQELLDHLWIRIEFNSLNLSVFIFALDDLFQDFTFESHFSVFELFLEQLLCIFGVHHVFLLVARVASDVDEADLLPCLHCLVLKRHIGQQQLLVIWNVLDLADFP